MSAFSFPVRVYYEDTDSGGVVYYANYLRFMERARTEWLRALGFELDELSREEGVVFAVRRANIDFARATRFNELLEVTVEPTKYGKASMMVHQQVLRDGEPVCTGEIQLACVDRDSFMPKPIPAPIVEKLKSKDR